MTRRAHRAGLAAAVVLILLGLAGAPTESQSAGAAPSRTLRLAGPAAGLARDLAWIRFQRARLAGDYGRAIRIAESAVALDPTSTDGWKLLAAHLAFFHGSREREPDLERRRLWFRAGVDVTRRGIPVADDPGELALMRAVLHLAKLDTDPEVLPGGPDELLRETELALTEAVELGSPEAEELLGYVLESSAD